MKSANKKMQATLGELYRRMSADFRAVRPADHRACLMPMVVKAHHGAEKANWTVEPLSSYCPFCQTLTQMIAAEYALRFDVKFFPDEAPRAPLMPAGCYFAAD